MKKIQLLFSITLFTIGAFAQNEKMREAFYSSYSLEKAGNIPGAISNVQSVYDDKSYECNLRLAYLEYISKAYNESAMHYRFAIELRPLAIEPRMGYVLPLIALNKWEEVIAEYKTILSIDSKNSIVNYRLGYIYYVRKDYKEAWNYFDRLVSLYPFDYDGLIMLAWTNHQLGKPADAKLYFEKALLYAPNDKSAKDGLSLIK
ncbi:MAG: tetratricopeptide repeat protein [Bacteroidia bacterium]